MNTEKMQMTSGIFHGIAQERHTYFIPCHREYSDHDQQNQCDIHAAHGEKVGCYSAEDTTTFL